MKPRLVRLENADPYVDSSGPRDPEPMRATADFYLVDPRRVIFIHEIVLADESRKTCNVHLDGWGPDSLAVVGTAQQVAGWLGFEVTE